MKNINILTLTIAYKGVAFPILFHIMPKFGNSRIQERLDLMERFVRLSGPGCIECLLADREFAENRWLEYLNRSGIEYHIRILDYIVCYSFNSDIFIVQYRHLLRIGI